ncbi:hypothetical protein Fmac_003360 [Flemingia macrophylla]|uniref:Uncharacterized protein n=1 Tax=Flemingia macrophylla TaxID=520843 RepID=A0ABD1NMK0_9FABA
MASPRKFSVFSVCVLVLFVVVAAQYGDPSNDKPNMSGMHNGPGPAPSSSADPRSITLIAILLPFMLTFLVVAKARI